MVKLWNQEPAQWRLELAAGDGKPLSLRTGETGRTLIVELGGKPTLETLRRACAKAVKTVKELGGGSAVLDASQLVESLGADALGALAQGAELVCHKQERWKETKDEPFALYLTGAAGAEAERVLQEADVLIRAVCFARDLVSCPANKLTPQDLARRTTEAAQALGIETQVLSEEETRALGMGAFLAVGESAGHRPCLIVLRYRGGREGAAPIALVGKGVCFDSGGYCLKPGESMPGMKGDMAGGAAVCGALLALAENKIPVNAVAVIPAVENRVSPDCFVPGDVITSMSGKTIEVGNTDAEGRLILADAITYALEKEGASRVVDIATLTGAIARMLGHTTAGLMANDDEFCAQLLDAAQRGGEQYWRMPDYPEYKAMLESPIADLSNMSNDGCGAIVAGLFIGAFAGDTPWIHLDIAGTGWADRTRIEYQPKGATGAGVTTLYELCKALAE